MKPALTAEEWAREWSMDEDNMGTPLARAIGTAVAAPEYAGNISGALHGLAALCLNGQDFGFTREDVTQLRRLVNLYESGDCGFHWQEEIAWANSLADRIEALLPHE